jgi:hypothetical protein
MKDNSLRYVGARRRQASILCAPVIGIQEVTGPGTIPDQSAFRRALVLGLTVSASLLLNVAWADQIVMKNGDRVTGSIVKKDGKNLTIKTDQFGVVTTSWDQVDSVQADKPVNIVLPDGRTVQGTIATANGKLEITTKDTKLSLAPGDIKTIRNDDEEKTYERLLKPSWAQLWTGAGTVGLAGTAGNAETLTFTTGITASRVTNTDKTSLYFNTIKASALSNGKNTNTAEAVRGGIDYNHNLHPRVFVDVFNDYEYDKFQNLNLRFVLGGGFGFHAVKTERARLDLLGGADFNHSSFSTPLIQKTAEGYFGDDYSLKLSGTTSLVQSFRMFDDVTNGGQYRINFDTGLSTKIGKRLTWNVSLSDRYLNHPAPGRKTNDFLYTTGLGITFAK